MQSQTANTSIESLTDRKSGTVTQCKHNGNRQFSLAQYRKDLYQQYGIFKFIEDKHNPFEGNERVADYWLNNQTPITLENNETRYKMSKLYDKIDNLFISETALSKHTVSSS